MKCAALAVSLLVVVAACSRRDVVPVDRWSDAAMLAEGARYIDDPTFRRAAVTESLTNPHNTYSRQRLTSYALQTRGWDLLPEWNPRSLVLTRALAADIAAGREPAANAPPLWDGKRPATMAEWVALGHEVFFRYPLRKETFVAWGIANEEAAKRVGIRVAEDGTYPGVVAFVDTLGHHEIGMTCAICHADVAGGKVIVGQARRSFDYGALRLAYHAATNTSPDTDLARRMKSWGPGRADVTEDDDEDPVAIPDLWGLRLQSFLTQAGTIKQSGPTALAIRQETQLLTSNQQTVRPPRVLAFALAMYLYSLRPPPVAASPPETARGKTLFAQQCASCHSNAAYGGDLVAVDRVDTDAALANGGARGTGHYRTPPLVHVADAAPYFHDGTVATLEDVLSPERLMPSFTRGFLGKGPVKGHRFGTELSAPDREALVAFLRTL